MTLAHIDQNQSLTAHIALDHGAILRALNINVNDPKAQALILACEKYGLDPLLKHAVLISGNLYVTRDGLLAIAHRDGRLDGIVIEEEGENAQEWWAKVTVHVKGMSHGFTYRGRYPKDGQQKKYGPEMAVKCAEVMALRRAFGVTGIPTMEEQWDVLAATGPPLATPEQVDKIDSLLPVVPDDAMPALKAWKAEQGISMKAGEFTAEHADMVVAKLEELVEVSGGGEPLSPPAAAPGVRTGGEEIGGASLVDPANPCTDPSGVSPAPDRQAPAATTTVEPDTLLGDEVGTAPPAGTAPGGGKNVTGGGQVPPTATPSGDTPATLKETDNKRYQSLNRFCRAVASGWDEDVRTPRWEALAYQCSGGRSTHLGELTPEEAQDFRARIEDGAKGRAHWVESDDPKHLGWTLEAGA